MTGALFLLIFIFLIALGIWWQRRGSDLSLRVLAGVAAGAVFGSGLKIAGLDTQAAQFCLRALEWVTAAYVWLLELAVLPFVAVACLSAVIKLGSLSEPSRVRASTLGLLLGTTLLSAAVGVVLCLAFALKTDGLIQVAQGLRVSAWSQHAIPATAALALLLGMAAMALKRESVESAEKIASCIEISKLWVVRSLRIVLTFTPYGVLAWMAFTAATASVNDLLGLAGFAVAIHVGFVVVLHIHAGLVAISGVSPIRYFRAAWPVLKSAFVSGSSAAALPENVTVQTQKLAVPETIAQFSASIGTTTGQNACGGLFPAMLAVMIAVGPDTASPAFLCLVIGISVAASFAISSTGGGATFAAILVLAMLDQPVALAGFMVCLEPIIDMGRTAVNVNGSMVAGVFTQRWAGRPGKADEHH